MTRQAKKAKTPTVAEGKVYSWSREEFEEMARVYFETYVKTNTPGCEVLNELFHRIPFGEKFTLSNGKVAVIVPWFEPCEEQDAIHAGIDVVYEDGSGHIEFILKQTGWGGRP